jgi:anti-anti-sigma factor
VEQSSEDSVGCEVLWSAGGVTLSGDIDAVNASVIEQRIRALLGAAEVVVDCRAVTFLDVAGLRMLAQVGISAIARGAVLRLRCSRAMTETFNVCGMRELPGLQLELELELELELDDHDSPGSLR